MRVTRIVLAAALVTFALVWQADAAFAKILPVTSIEVTTTQPMVGHRVDLRVRFAPNFKLGDAEWENHEVSVVPTSKADAAGWPLDRTDHGMPVRLRRISTGVFGGTFVVRKPGDYVVFAWSSVHAREDRVHGVVTRGHFAPPVRLRVVRGALTTSPRVARVTAQTSSQGSLALWISAAILSIGIGAAVIIRRVHSRRRVGAKILTTP